MTSDRFVKALVIATMIGACLFFFPIIFAALTIGFVILTLARWSSELDEEFDEF